MTKSKPFVDLHSHTIYSDGTSTPLSLVRDMATSSVDYFALTDHDTTRGYADASKEAKKWNLGIIPGVEISTNPYHLLGLGVDVDNKPLQTLLTQVRHYQRENTKAKIEAIASTGVPINWDVVETLFPDPQQRLGSMNILFSLLQHAPAREYLQSKFEDIIVGTLMKQYLKRNGVASKIKVYEDIDPKLAIDAIHNAGGKAIIAHPFKEVKNLESELKTLREKGLDGIEMQPNFGMKNLPFLQYATRHNMLVTYGSDYHGGSMSARHLLGRVQNNAIDIAPYLRN